MLGPYADRCYDYNMLDALLILIEMTFFFFFVGVQYNIPNAIPTSNAIYPTQLQIFLQPDFWIQLLKEKN